MKNVRFRRSCSGTCFLNSGTEILIWSVRKQSENIISKRRSQQEKAMDTVATCLRTGRIMQRCCEAIWKRKNEQEPHSTETVFPQYFQQIMQKHGFKQRISACSYQKILPESSGEYFNRRYQCSFFVLERTMVYAGMTRARIPIYPIMLVPF